VRADVSDIGDPELVRGIDIELPVQGIVGHDSGVTTIGTWLLFVTDLGPCPGQTCQTPNPIGANIFADVAQIVMQLAVSINFPTFLPSSLQQHGLASIL